ncbi:hypothetical protein PIIN_06766 [Serendipita indica DSM 11827]|uniref:DUF962 domain protein n=1 Tax=Serendipita indica (strain DSM 11827) TaxID=1109443 RepID=G4TND3_SERID|nr:hypothetical protein PIIN_06766 [Serendipita indica DSM 11827]
MAGIFNVKDQLAFYGSYHSNKVNVAIHIVCVPLIVWSTLVWLSAVPLPESLQAFNLPSLYVNQYISFQPTCAWLFVAAYETYYFILEPVAALIYLPEFLLSLGVANSFSHRPNAMLEATAVHVFSWIMQFIGHGKFEGRAPALLDNLVGALFLAPFFVHLEILFALGYRPDLHKALKNSVGVKVTEFRKSKAQEQRAAKKEL